MSMNPVQQKLEALTFIDEAGHFKNRNKTTAWLDEILIFGMCSTKSYNCLFHAPVCVYAQKLSHVQLHGL